MDKISSARLHPLLEGGDYFIAEYGMQDKDDKWYSIISFCELESEVVLACIWPESVAVVAARVYETIPIRVNTGFTKDRGTVISRTKPEFDAWLPIAQALLHAAQEEELVEFRAPEASY